MCFQIININYLWRFGYLIKSIIAFDLLFSGTI